jgi:indolepyruvate ferredoxin oxidoreductase
MLFHLGIPSLFPGNVQEILDLGLHGYNMSRLSGLWVGPEDRDQRRRRIGNRERLARSGLDFVTPDLTFDGKPFTPTMNLGMNVRAQALEMEQSLYTRRLEVAKRYARANKLNHVVFENPGRLARHHHGGEDLQRPAAGVPRAGPRRPRRCAATACAS